MSHPAPPLIVRNSEVLQTDVNGDMVALDVDSGACFGFNATATRVWQLLETPRTVQSLVDQLTGEFEVGREECRSAVDTLISDLTAHGLIRTE